MKTALRLVPVIFMVIVIASCGYRNPNVYSGPHKTIYLKEWKNRTSELTLNSKLYRSLTKWYQKSKNISTKRDKEGADLILAGEIISIELPSLSYGANNVATEVKVKLRVRYILKDLASNKILLEVPGQNWTEEYLVSSNSSTNSDNEQDAIDQIIEDLSQRIYQRTIAELPNL